MRRRVDDRLGRIVGVCARSRGDCGIESVGLQASDVRWGCMKLEAAVDIPLRGHPGLRGSRYRRRPAIGYRSCRRRLPHSPARRLQSVVGSAPPRLNARGSSYLGVVGVAGAIACLAVNGRGIDCRRIWTGRRDKVVRGVGGPWRIH
jgi:hypothetical protein